MTAWSVQQSSTSPTAKVRKRWAIIRGRSTRSKQRLLPPSAAAPIRSAGDCIQSLDFVLPSLGRDQQVAYIPALLLAFSQQANAEIPVPGGEAVRAAHTHGQTKLYSTPYSVLAISCKTARRRPLRFPGRGPASSILHSGSDWRHPHIVEPSQAASKQKSKIRTSYGVLAKLAWGPSSRARQPLKGLTLELASDDSTLHHATVPTVRPSHQSITSITSIGNPIPAPFSTVALPPFALPTRASKRCRGKWTIVASACRSCSVRRLDPTSRSLQHARPR